MGVNRQLYAVLVAVFCVVLCKVVRAALLDLVEVLVGIEVAFFTLDNRNGNVGAVVGNALEVCEKIGKHKAVLDGAFAVLETDRMLETDIVLEIVDNLLERFDVHGKGNIVFAVCVFRNGKDFINSGNK